MVLGQTSDRSRSQVRRGYLSRQDSRNFRSSASPPPSRSSHHASSWFGHRNSSQSPPRYRNGGGSYHGDYDVRSTRYGRSPERSSYRDSQTHTKYKEDYTGYPQESGYTAAEGYRRGYGGEYDGHYHSRTSGYSSSVPGYSTGELYHGTPTSAIPRSYQSAYGGSNVYESRYAESIKLKVPLCCEACEERITNHMLALEGVESVTCDQVKQKVTVRGTASPSEILRQGRECFKNTRFW